MCWNRWGDSGNVPDQQQGGRVGYESQLDNLLSPSDAAADSASPALVKLCDRINQMIDQ